MKHFFESEVNYDELDFLRRNTILGPIAKIKLQRAKKYGDDFRKWYLEMERELLEADYTFVDELEYEMRLRTWENKCANSWKKYPDGLDLSEFARMVMESNMPKDKKR